MAMLRPHYPCASAPVWTCRPRRRDKGAAPSPRHHLSRLSYPHATHVFCIEIPYGMATVPAAMVAAAVRIVLASATPQASELRRKSDAAVRFPSDDPAPVIRSPINADKAYRARASLREACRHDPSALADAIPADINERVTIIDRIAEAHALLDAVNDPRPATLWFDADPNETVALFGYVAPQARLRSRRLPGVAVTRGPCGEIVITLREKDLNPPKSGRPRCVH